MITEINEPWFEKCEDCDCITFWVQVTPRGQYATENDWICTKCGELVGGVINDPFNEIPSVPLSEFIENSDNEECDDDSAV